MGRLSQICGLESQTATTNNSKTEFDRAEQAAFEHVKEALRGMRYCCLEDLQQAAFSYYCEGFRIAGVPIREEYARGKAARLGAWWHQKHSASRTPRPHTQYTPAQSLRGRHVAAVRKRGRNDWTALQVQLARQGGAKVAEVAGQLGCTTRNIYKLSKRRFPRIVLAVLVLAFGVNVLNSSGWSVPQKHGSTDQRETLPTFTLDDVRPAAPPPLGQTDDIDRVGMAEHGEIVDELAARFPQWAEELEKLRLESA